MIKEILLLSVIASVTACKSYSPESQCDPEKNYIKNYIKSNPEAIKLFKKKKSQGLIRSIYYENKNPSNCNDNLCVYFDDTKYDFIEKNFKDQYRNGVYTIKVDTKKQYTDSECISQNPATSNIKDKKCFVIEKNENNIIKSDYKWSLDSEAGLTTLKFEDLKNNILLSEFVYQVYSTGAIGGPGGGVCKPTRINNKNYKYDPYELQ